MTNQLTVETIRNMGKNELLQFIERGILHVEMTLYPLPSRREETPEYMKHAHLKGQGISISEGARKYGLHSSTVTRWVQKNLIARIGQEKNRVIIDEADLAFCAEVQRNRPGQGKWLFSKTGLPYIPETTEK